MSGSLPSHALGLVVLQAYVYSSIHLQPRTTHHSGPLSSSLSLLSLPDLLSVFVSFGTTGYSEAFVTEQKIFLLDLLVRFPLISQTAGAFR